MTDAETLAVYAAQAEAYARRFAGDAPSRSLRDFIALMPPAGRVLDLGCGPGAASAHMRAAGLRPDPVDAAPDMVALANRDGSANARVASFDDLDAAATYDGIWANFSLLHAPRDALPRHLAAIARALRPGGWLHIGMKTGTGAHRDALGRFYTYVGVTELRDMLTTAGLAPKHTVEGVETGLAGTDDPFVLIRAQKETA